MEAGGNVYGGGGLKKRPKMRLGVLGLSILVLVSSVCASTGLSIAPSPELLINPPQNSERASSPSYIPKAGNEFAPESSRLPQATPPGAFLAPPLQPIPSPPPLTKPAEPAPAPASPLDEISPPTFEAAPINIHPVPSLQAPAPSQHGSMNHKFPGTISPSADGQPKGPTLPADEPSPSNLIPPPKTDVGAKAPINISPPAMPRAHALAPERSARPHEPPVASPILTPPTVLAPPIELAPPTALAPQSRAGALPPTLARSPISHDERHMAPVGTPPGEMNKHLSPVNNSHFKDSSPPSNLPQGDKNHTIRSPTISHAPSPEAPLHLKLPMTEAPYPPSLAPLPDHQRRDRKEVPKATSTALSPSHSQSHAPGSLETHPPKVSPRFGRHRAPPTFVQDGIPPPIQAPAPSLSAPAPVPRPRPPVINPDSFPNEPNETLPPMVWSLPPPPPNLDCNSLVCYEPLTNPPPGAPCICVWPIKVGLRLKVEIYTFFPLVSEFAQEIASGMYMKQSQVRIMGADVASEQPEDSIVLLHLVPLEEKFQNNTAFFVYERFWHKQIVIKTATFGDYDVLYVLYPGLPASPPSAPLNINFGDGSFGSRSNARAIKPLGVDIEKPKERLSGSMIALIIVSSVVALTLCVGAAWLLMTKEISQYHPFAASPHVILPVFTKSSGTGHVLLSKRAGSESGSFSSSVATYAGSSKTFSLAEIDMATNRFDDSRIIGEGGFGRVYKGTLEDGTQIAVKILKRDDLQGEREFLAEVEMLSRLHHRNLVKLIGICTEENVRCLVYELIGNGSVESHLHGVDKENAPLDWNVRMKIALGAARGLAYLHEDSSPRVIHRDFKCSNILLEQDYTPKVSDFGLARAALDEGNQHISTQIMGTFGYVAPEYAMTGHLLVKSDVYSYGVVLLELLTGRKPVDMSQPPGQENLVAWARPLLTSMDGLETIVDPALGTKVAFDSIAKVAAIASMCVQPEVSHRPFMGEVVQALKLVCSECSENALSDGCSKYELSAQAPAIRTGMPAALESEPPLLASDVFGTSPTYDAAAGDDSSGSSLWLFGSGPLRVGKSRQFWQRLRSMSAGSMNDRSISTTTGTSLDSRSP